ncbi:MAG: hypothetical protein AMS17_14415 [Spirochaetes bacterium DG_61]|jgi:hypothetical protein|nr:MAG: hypothetical protein AMS17_14415 [Spirochaetes bacterium DG_61]
MTLKYRLESLNIYFKFALLVAGAALFFVLFPFLHRYGTVLYILFAFFLLLFGVLFRFVAGRKTFRITLWLWASGSLIYLVIAFFLILKGVQPLPYLRMGRPEMILYYVSYPLRVLGIFFSGLIFSSITSPIEFLRWGEKGLKIALAYRAFEYSMNAFEENRVALLIQGAWPDFTGRGRKLGLVFKAVQSAPLLVATTFRNLILWFPWAWICYNSLRKNIAGRKEK